MVFKKKKDNQNRQLNVEKPKDTKKALGYLFKLLKENKGAVLGTTITNIISTTLFAGVPWATAVAIDRILDVIRNDEITDKWASISESIFLPIILIVGIAVINFCLNYYQEYQMAKVGETVSLSLRKKLTDKLTKLPLKFYDGTQVGEILSKATTDIDKISEIIVTGFNQFIYSVVTILLGVILLFVINVKMALLVLVILIIGSIVTVFVSNANQKLFHKNMLTLSTLSNVSEETLAGNLVVKSFSKEKDFVTKLDKLIDDQFKASSTSQFVNFSIYPVIRFINQMAFILAAMMGANYAVQGIVTIGLMQAFLQYVVQISEPISNSSYLVNSFQGALVSIERIQQILSEEEDIVNDKNLDIEKPEGKVSFKNVSFGYSPQNTLMKDVSFDVKPHQMVAIVGPTGAGKTTLVNLLMRFYEINSGKIYFDDVDTTDLSRENLRKNFGMVLQDTWLFKGTVADNIAYGNKDATREHIIEAAKVAQCDNFIRKLPQGYDTIISSDDGMISQGEQQLLTIARAVLSDPKVMILDEATSSVDTKTEKEIQTAIARVMKGRTSFVIAHRLSTIRNADLILVMEKGNIIEKGNHDELIEQDNLYAELYRTQFQ